MNALSPKSLGGQLILLVLLSVALAQTVSVVVTRIESRRRVVTYARDELTGRISAAHEIMRRTPPAARDAVLRDMSNVLSRFWISTRPPATVAEWQRGAKVVMAEPIAAGEYLPAMGGSFRGDPMLELVTGAVWGTGSDGALLGGEPVGFAVIPEWRGYGLYARIDNDAWLNLVDARPTVLDKSEGTPAYLAALSGAALLISGGAWLIARRIARPLRHLAEGAERLGRGEEVAALDVEGPEDIRSTITAFNQMQVRLRRFVEDRTHMLAAIGHDLRTPITALRLRAEYVSDPETREKILATLAEMQAMVESTLAFAKAEAVAEPTRVVDVNALVGSLCEDLRELGWDVSFSGETRAPTSCRSDLLRRAISNVIENAVRYGGSARVSLQAGPGLIEVIVDDSGPGIPEADREKIFAPFVRLETSRNRNTGGVGLGLTTARSTVRGHGGDILLETSPTGGLRVRIAIPRSA